MSKDAKNDTPKMEEEKKGEARFGQSPLVCIEDMRKKVAQREEVAHHQLLELFPAGLGLHHKVGSLHEQN